MEPWRLDVLEYEAIFSGSKLLVLEEMRVAEDNFNKIVREAKKAQSVFSELPGSNFSTSSLERVVSDLKTIFSFVRLRIRQEYPDIDLSGRVASKDDTLPQLKTNSYSCLCPLTIILRLIGQSFTQLQVESGKRLPDTLRPLQGFQPARVDIPKRDYGVLVSLRGILERLSKQLTVIKIKNRANQEVHFSPGVAQCLMFHEENGEFTVTSSSIRYRYLTGLWSYGSAVRKEYIRGMRSRCPISIQERIAELERHSDDLWRQLDSEQGGDPERKDFNNPFAQPKTKAHIPGLAATFTPTADYKPACLTDFCRFVIEKPPAATIREQKITAKADRTGKRNRPPFSASSCAEWEMWVTIVGRPGPSGPPVRYVSVWNEAEALRKAKTSHLQGKPAPHITVPPRSMTMGRNPAYGWQPPPRGALDKLPRAAHLDMGQPAHHPTYPAVPGYRATPSRPTNSPYQPSYRDNPQPRPNGADPRQRLSPQKEKAKKKSRSCCLW